MTQEQQEAFDAVEKINEEIYERYKDTDLSLMPIVIVTFANDMTFIAVSIPSSLELSLPEISIYSSVNDDRTFYEKSNKYETFYCFIKRKFQMVKEEIYAIKI